MESSASIVFIESQRMSPRKKTVIEILRDNPGFVSGQAISDSLGISRNAVHKHVNTLRARGFRILGISRRGYRLEEEPRRLVMPVVAKLTQAASSGQLVQVLRRDRIDQRRSPASCRRRGARRHRDRRRKSAQGPGPPGPHVDLAAGQGSALLGDPQAGHRHDRRPPADAHRGRRRRRGHRGSGRRSRSTSSGPTTSSSTTRRPAGSSSRCPASRTASTGWSRASASTSTSSSPNCPWRSGRRRPP